jgi:hypothetical protein
MFLNYVQGDNIKNKSFIIFLLRNEIRIVFIFYLIYIIEINRLPFGFDHEVYWPKSVR